jgi:glycosyltransferase involved in cell wall biosynthesis
MKVLVFSSDILPLPGLPTSGGGLRSWQLIQGLKSVGLEVEYSMPIEDRYLSALYLDKIPEEAKTNAWNKFNQRELVEKIKPDVIVFANPDLNFLPYDIDIPIACDLHGPRIIEFELMSGDTDAKDRSRRLSIKLNNLARADFLTCAGKNQRYYFLAFLLQTGQMLKDIKIEYIPVSLSPELPKLLKKNERINFVYAGGFYPWQQYHKGLFTLANFLKNTGKGILEIYGGSHRLNWKDIEDFHYFKSEVSYNNVVHFKGYVTREELIEKYCSSWVAFEVMGRNFERELAFTTRTVEFLWCGLPVVYNNYSNLSPYIKEYKAGWCVDPSQTSQINEVTNEILNNPNLVLEYGYNAQKLVQEHFTWDKTIKPLAEFCMNPVKKPQQYSVLVVRKKTPKMTIVDYIYTTLVGGGLTHFITKSLKYIVWRISSFFSLIIRGSAGKIKKDAARRVSED